MVSSKSGQNSVPRRCWSDSIVPPTSEPSARPPCSQCQPSEGWPSAWSLQVLLLVPIEELVRPPVGGLDPSWRPALTRRSQERLLGVLEHRWVLGEVGEQCRPIQRGEPGPLPDRDVEHRGVGEPHEDGGVLANQVEVEERQQVAGVIATDCRQDEPDVGIAKHRVEVGDPVRRGVRQVPLPIESVLRELRLEAERLEAADTPLHAMRE